MTESNVHALLVGRAFRCKDGLVRWITHLSTRNNFTLLWLNEEDKVWHMGGTLPAAKWQGGEEYPVPAMGEQYDMHGIYSVRTKTRDF